MCVGLAPAQDRRTIMRADEYHRSQLVQYTYVSKILDENPSPKNGQGDPHILLMRHSQVTVAVHDPL